MSLRRTTTLIFGAFALVVGAVVLAGCTTAETGRNQPPAGSDSAAAPTLELVAPTDGGEVAAGDVAISVKTTGLKFVIPSNTIVPGEGHVHFTLDDEPFKMSTSPDYVFEGVAPGEHTLVAELVQNDTKPFGPPVTQQVTFTAK